MGAFDGLSATTILSLFCLLILLATQTAEAKIRRYKWEVSYQFKSPDCYKKLVVAINGRTPGPTILAHQGDTIIVELKNSLVTENIAIHWHGIRQVQSISGILIHIRCPKL